ncbi:MAG: extracellular solute-binding protein [Undibacterium sp.]|nr:extracellular solute-binding protein [Undibacterium sp.]
MQFWRALGSALFILLTSQNLTYAGTLVIESWRADDKLMWEKVIIPAFEKKYPGITLKFSATAPTEYDASIATRLADGTAGELITCRPFDVSLSLYRRGYLEKLDGASGMQYFPPSSMLAWQTDDGQDSFCMPIASVIHGYLYNQTIFKSLNLQAPKTLTEFFTVLEAIKKNSNYVPVALGTKDKWEASQTVFTNSGPSFWHGEDGRRALILGKAKLTDAPFVAAFEFQAKLGNYLAKNPNQQSYADSQRLFAQGGAAIFPLGSWDLAYFNRITGLEFGVFAPPVPNPGEACFISDHMDLGIGINRHASNKEDAYKFLAWVGSQEFAMLYTNYATGFFSLSNHLISVQDPIAQQMLDWRNRCSSSMRLNAHLLDRGIPNFEHALWDVNALLLNGKIKPKNAAKKLQTELAKWTQPRRP